MSHEYAHQAEAIEALALRWHERMEEGDLTESQREEFYEWLYSDSRHEQAFREIDAVQTLAQELSNQGELPIREVQAPQRTRSLRPARMMQWLVAGTVAAGLVFAGLAAQHLSKYYDAWRGEDLVTRAAEIKTIVLPEGSTIQLNTRTHVRWIGSSGERRVELISGEALFSVARDEKRPFTVVLDDSEIKVLGTKFNVYRKTDGLITVTVLEGAVEVRGEGGRSVPPWSRQLAPLEQLAYRSTGPVIDSHAADVEQATVWLVPGARVVNDMPLHEFVAELSRYSDKPIISPTVSPETRVSGRYDFRDVKQALRALEFIGELQVRETGTAIVVEPAVTRRNNDEGR